MIRLALVAIAGLSLSAVPAVAQSWGGTHDPSDRSGDRFSPYPTGYGERAYPGGYGARRSNAVPSNFDWRGQLDRPGDFRCDRFQDANRDDCGAGWRDQRRQAGLQAWRNDREPDGDRHDDSGRGPYGYANQRGHGAAWNQDHARGSTTWHGAYGRPDHVYPGRGVVYSRGHAGGYNTSYGSRADWCRANFQSYDPRTGYYRAYTGRLIYCG
ncbi:MAG: hypothetical protein RJB12_929 [Pseudomonadota bacterium]|jgi:hypothetical protein